VQRVPGGEVSPYLVDEARPGDRVELRGPIGGWFVWRHDDVALGDKLTLVRAVIELVGDRTIAVERERLSKVMTFAGLRRWRDALVENNALQKGRYGVPIGSLANEVADQDSIARRKLHDLFSVWQELFGDLLRRFQKAGLIQREADVSQLAIGHLAAVQGGYLLAPASRDVTPMASAIDMALAHLHMLGSTRDTAS
jgi:hypothetical protein